MLDVQISVARSDQRQAISNLLQLYTHDFSENWVGRPEGELGEDGRFPEYPLDAYWREPFHIPLLVRSNGGLAGFALLNASSHSGRAVDWNMAEFFIARKYRRGGLGTAAAHAIFGRHPGQWEAAVARRNTAALSFWRRAVASHPAVEAIEESDLATTRWNGPLLRFRIRPTP